MSLCEPPLVPMPDGSYFLGESRGKVPYRENGGASFKLRETNEAPRCKRERGERLPAPIASAIFAGNPTRQPRLSRDEAPRDVGFVFVPMGDLCGLIRCARAVSMR
jgi:hypothetical protein